MTIPEEGETTSSLGSCRPKIGRRGPALSSISPDVAGQLVTGTPRPIRFVLWADHRRLHFFRLHHRWLHRHGPRTLFLGGFATGGLSETNSRRLRSHRRRLLDAMNAPAEGRGRSTGGRRRGRGRRGEVCENGGKKSKIRRPARQYRGKVPAIRFMWLTDGPDLSEARAGQLIRLQRIYNFL